MKIRWDLYDSMVKAEMADCAAAILDMTDRYSVFVTRNGKTVGKDHYSFSEAVVWAEEELRAASKGMEHMMQRFTEVN